jgi:hypothetical protein
MCPGFDSTSKNEYQVNPGGKSGRCVRLTTYHLHVPMSRNLGALTSWNPVGLIRPVMGLVYLFKHVTYFLDYPCRRFHSCFSSTAQQSDIRPWPAYHVCLATASLFRLLMSNICLWNPPLLPQSILFHVCRKVFCHRLYWITSSLVRIFYP